jgi:competence protein ComEC
LFALLGEVEIGRVIHNGHAPESPLYDSLLTALSAHRIPHRGKHSGDTLRISPTAWIDVLQGGEASDDANDGSLVLQIRYGDTRFLFTGDAEGASERALVRRYGHRLRSDVVKVGHHGSRTSSTPPFVDAASDPTNPPLAIVSVAESNRYGLPDEEPLALWKSVGAELLTTAEEGALWVRSDGRAVQRIDWR